MLGYKPVDVCQGWVGDAVLLFGYLVECLVVKVDIEVCISLILHAEDVIHACYNLGAKLAWRRDNGHLNYLGLIELKLKSL